MPSQNELRWAYNQTKSEGSGALVKAWNNVRRFSIRLVNKIYTKLPRKLKYVVRTLKKLEVKIHNKLVCYEPTLRRSSGKLKFPNQGQRYVLMSSTIARLNQETHLLKDSPVLLLI